jgi:hypothetical protein
MVRIPRSQRSLDVGVVTIPIIESKVRFVDYDPINRFKKLPEIYLKTFQLIFKVMFFKNNETNEDYFEYEISSIS